MSLPTFRTGRRILTACKSGLTVPAALAFLPAICLGAFWLGGEVALIACALGTPAILAIAGAGQQQPSGTIPRDSATGLLLREGFEDVLEDVHARVSRDNLRSACFVLEIDDLQELADRHGQAAADTILARCSERVQSVLRDSDSVARVADSRLAICLSPTRHLDLELCVQLAGRLQTSLENPLLLDGLTVYLGCSVGFCLGNHAPEGGADAWMSAAITALTDAQQAGPSGIRAFSSDMRLRVQAHCDLRNQVAGALENGEIQPWYQPQISTDTGRVTGFEALARWTHPERGVIPPDQFLPAIAHAGLLEVLGQTMLCNVLTALKAWDAAGVDVPRVGVNFTPEELRNPDLVDRIKWDLDRFELTPDRLCIEVLETVVSGSPDDMITRNIAALGALGCRVDLDDFGTGNASLAAIRRFSVSRIKIDRSFVTKSDRDPEQQRMVGAILTMAERLGIETLAEGVETVGEHALLAQLGCDHVQGFGIGRPMPFEYTLDWIAAHLDKLQDAPTIGRESG